MVLARTLKGKGLAAIEGKDGVARQSTQEGRRNRPRDCGAARSRSSGDAAEARDSRGRARKAGVETQPDYSKVPAPAYKKGDSIATREAWGVGLAAVGKVDTRVVALDADVKNSTFSDKFEKVAPERFYENFIAEQVMVGAAMGLAARGAIPFPSTFACFLTRASDFMRMGGVSFSNVKFSGSHCGVSIGEDGPSQMALEDLAMMRSVPGCAVLYPCDGMSTERLVVEMARRQGMAYMRTSRPKTPVLYGPDETFPIGGSKVLRQSDNDAAVVIGAGVTVFEALKACDQLKAEGISIRVIDAYSVQPIDAATMMRRGEGHGGEGDHGRGSLCDRRDW